MKAVKISDYPDILTIEEAAKLLQTSTKTVYKLVRDGSLHSIKVGRAYRISKKKLTEYVEQ